MIDREMVLKGLECCSNVDDCKECPFRGADPYCMEHMASEVLELLKEQEPVKPIFAGDDDWMCSNCGETVGWKKVSNYGLDNMKHKYCPECGRKVKWDS